jgi:NitT/TauT family transport system permease protein
MKAPAKPAARFTVRRYLRRPHLLYETTLAHHLVSVAVAIVLCVVIVVLGVHFANPKNIFDINKISFRDVLTASANTFYRMLLAYLLAVVAAIPLAMVIGISAKVQRLLLPIADILQSVPVLAFFPVVVVFFTAYHAFELAAVFVIFVSMLWNIVFTVIGGLQTIPDDIKSAAIVFNVTGLKKFWYITLPAVVPFVVTGSLLAWAQGWTVVIVAEVLHTYIPHGTLSQDLLGLGSLMVDSNAGGQTSVFVATLVAMILLVTVMNLAVWQPLLRFSQRFRFD